MDRMYRIDRMGGSAISDWLGGEVNAEAQRTGAVARE